MLRVRKKANLEATQAAFPHQLEAFEAAKDLPYSAIFHEQGLGKTKIGLDLGAFLAFTRRRRFRPRRHQEKPDCQLAI